ncbi:MAG: DUF2891 family protein, partial [Actinobacteria bacterium]|nr:DUF2891 family protein [Actinomycetota bacterium]
MLSEREATVIPSSPARRRSPLGALGSTLGPSGSSRARWGSRAAGGLRRGRSGGTVDLAAEWGTLLRQEGAGYARVALANIRREFPAGLHHTMKAPGDFPYRPRARTPVFYGSYDWHSCVEMHWLLVRLLRVAAETVPVAKIRSTLDTQFSPVAMAAEADFISGRDGLSERPYGWGWALALAHEVQALASPRGEDWAAVLAPLADAVTGAFLHWLPKATYPVRYGVHGNSAFGLSRALPYARDRAAAGDPSLLTAIMAKAHEWFGGDTLYPGGWEPSGHDFLSPALTEAELMAQILPPAEFAAWLSVFLPGIA